MKKAIGYARISDQDQSNWSISGQKDLIKDYCLKNDIELVATFADEGESAKNFDRSDWKQLETFVKANHSQVDLLLVMAWTRFSRNTAEALQMIEQLERRYSIRVLSINEPLHLHPDSPYFHYIRTQIIQNGELELRINRDRTRFGIYQAQKAGRVVTRPPRGYQRGNDELGRPTLVIDQVKAPLIREAFERFLNGETIVSIRRTLMKQGLIIKGNSDLQGILRNPLYMGFVKQISYYDNPEALVKGIHDPIIDPDTWWRVQALFNTRKQIQRTTLSEDFPLRGVLKCYCHRNFTAAFSKGRSSLVGYYKCNTHTGVNLNANRIHGQFDEILEILSLPESHVKYLQEKILENVHEELADRKKVISKIQADITHVEKKIAGVEEKYFEGKIEDDVYRKWKKIYHSDRSSLRDQLNDMEEPIDQIWMRYNQNLSKLASLQWVYHELDVEEKQSFVREVFNNQLSYQDNIYRTTFLMDIFEPKALVLKEKRLLIYEPPPHQIGNFAGCAPDRS